MDKPLAARPGAVLELVRLGRQEAPERRPAAERDRRSEVLEQRALAWPYHPMLDQALCPRLLNRSRRGTRSGVLERQTKERQRSKASQPRELGPGEGPIPGRLEERALELGVSEERCQGPQRARSMRGRVRRPAFNPERAQPSILKLAFPASQRRLESTELARGQSLRRVPICSEA